jgi:hypothetical protein
MATQRPNSRTPNTPGADGAQRQNSRQPNTPGADGASQLPPGDTNPDGKIRKAFYFS